MNYLASPPLCVAYALAGTMDIDLYDEPLGEDRHGEPVFLKDIWPTRGRGRGDGRGGGPVGHVPQELRRGVRRRRALELARGADRRELSPGIRARPTSGSLRSSTTWPREPEPVADIERRARAGGARRQRHHRPHLAGRLDQARQPGRALPDRARRRAAGLQLLRLAARQPRGDDARDVRQHPPAQPAGARHRGRRDAATCPDGEQMSIYDAAMRYLEDGVPLVVLAGKEYGSGSSRDWAAKGTRLLGVRAVIAESFERIHRSNLVGMGVLPLQFAAGESAASLGLTGRRGVHDRRLAGADPIPRELTVRPTARSSGSRSGSTRPRSSSTSATAGSSSTSCGHCSARSAARSLADPGGLPG